MQTGIVVLAVGISSDHENYEGDYVTVYKLTDPVTIPFGSPTTPWPLDNYLEGIICRTFPATFFPKNPLEYPDYCELGLVEFKRPQDTGTGVDYRYSLVYAVEIQAGSESVGRALSADKLIKLATVKWGENDQIPESLDPEDAAAVKKAVSWVRDRSALFKIGAIRNLGKVLR